MWLTRLTWSLQAFLTRPWVEYEDAAHCCLLDIHTLLFLCWNFAAKQLSKQRVNIFNHFCLWHTHSGTHTHTHARIPTTHHPWSHSETRTLPRTCTYTHMHTQTHNSQLPPPHISLLTHCLLLPPSAPPPPPLLLLHSPSLPPPSSSTLLPHPPPPPPLRSVNKRAWACASAWLSGGHAEQCLLGIGSCRMLLRWENGILPSLGLPAAPHSRKPDRHTPTHVHEHCTPTRAAKGHTNIFIFTHASWSQECVSSDVSPFL